MGNNDTTDRILKILAEFFTNASFDNLEILSQYIAEDCVYRSEANSSTFKGKSEIIDIFEYIIARRIEDPDAIPATITEKLTSKATYSAGDKCIAMKYPEFNDVNSLVFAKANKEGLICYIDVVKSENYKYKLDLPQNWQGWTPRMQEIITHYDNNGNIIKVERNYLDGTPIKD